VINAYRPEFHIHDPGGYGWGMRRQGKSSDQWMDAFYFWTDALGLTRPAKLIKQRNLFP